MVIDVVGNPEGVHRAPGPLQRVVAEGGVEAIEQVIVDEADESNLVVTVGISYAQVEDYVNAQNIIVELLTKEYSKVMLFILSQGKAVARNDNK
jgi:uncharacterized protein YaiI (UPF0178 family)